MVLNLVILLSRYPPVAVLIRYYDMNLLSNHVRSRYAKDMYSSAMLGYDPELAESDKGDQYRDACFCSIYMMISIHMMTCLLT